MKATFGERLRQRLLRRGRPRPERERTSRGAKREREVIEEIAEDFTTEELQEFLEGDLHPDQADPEFKDRLREQLWKMLEDRRNGRDGH